MNIVCVCSRACGFCFSSFFSLGSCSIRYFVTFGIIQSRWSPSLRGPDVGQYSDFIEGLGPGQLVGRQVLGASSLGDIQLSMCHQKGCLEVEVIRARGLQVRIQFENLSTKDKQKFIQKKKNHLSN